MISKISTVNYANIIEIFLKEWEKKLYLNESFSCYLRTNYPN